VQFIRRDPEAPSLSLEGSFGNERTPDFSAWGGTRVGAWTLDASSDLFYTGGYILVPRSQRGGIDTPANSEHGTLDLGIGHQLGNHGLFFARTNLFEESRHNGTPLQTNDTSILEPMLGIDTPLGTNSSITARVFGDVQNYHQSFSAISADRSQEFLTNLQHVPAQEQLALDVALERPQDRVLAAGKLGGDAVIELQLSTQRPAPPARAGCRHRTREEDSCPASDVPRRRGRRRAR